MLVTFLQMTCTVNSYVLFKFIMNNHVVYIQWQVIKKYCFSSKLIERKL